MPKNNATETVYNYLQSQNRPYSANDIMQNLHNEFGKACVQKALDDLTRENKIREKIYGKQKIYSVTQEEVEESGAENMECELSELDSEIEKLGEKLKAVQSELKITEGALKELKNQPTLDACIKERDKLEKDLINLTDKVHKLSEVKVNISDEERIQMKNDSETYTKEYKNRKRICMDILNSILENCSKTKKALLEEISIETDEDVGFKLTQMQ